MTPVHRMDSGVVILTEDAALTRVMAFDALIEAEFRVMEAIEAEEALGLLRSQADDVELLITDIHMPGPIDGLELARQVHRQWPWIMLLIVSGQVQPTSAEMPVGSHFLSKLYDPNHMVARVQE